MLQLENPEYLREYHNQNCSLSERLEDDIVQGMKLYIPSLQEICEINKKIRAENRSFYDFPVDGKFPFDFTLWKGTYQITQAAYSGDILLTKYENKVRLDFDGIKNGNYHFLFSAFDFRKDEAASEINADTLARMCMEQIYPIQYIVDAEGKIVDVKLTKKPEDIVPELDSIKSFFPDQYSLDYIEKMKDIIKNTGIISHKFKNTLLNSFMFGAFYRVRLAHWTDSKTYEDFYPWIFDAKPIRFEFQNTLSAKDVIDDERVKIQQKGISSDHRSLEDLYFTDSEYNEFKSTLISQLLMIRMIQLLDADSFYTLSELSKDVSVAYNGVELYGGKLAVFFIENPLFFIQQGIQYHETTLLASIFPQLDELLVKKSFFKDQIAEINLQNGQLFLIPGKEKEFSEAFKEKYLNLVQRSVFFRPVYTQDGKIKRSIL